jgi:hypothetical protein
MSPDSAPSDRTRVRRIPRLASYDRDQIHSILDAGILCQVALVENGQPFVVPMAYARDGDRLLLHGSKGSRLLKYLAAGEPCCVNVTLLDGLVLARSSFNHSMNYRSVTVLGCARAIDDPQEKIAALDVLVDTLIPGRLAEARGPNEKELAQTEVVALSLEEASAKVRTGPPGDDEEDIGLPIWAGELPFLQVYGEPVNSPDLQAGIDVPESVRSYRRPGE